MQRRSFIKNTAFAAGALSLLNSSSLAQLLADPAFKITMLTDTIGMFTERGGTILFMISKKGVVVVDSQFPDTAAHLVEEIKKKTKKPFRLLINTHHHGDHSGGNIIFKELLPHVLAHANSKINQQAAAVKDKIAGMNDITMLKMYQAISICVASAKIMKAYLFFTKFLAPGISIGLIGV